MTIATAGTMSVQTLVMAGGRGERLFPLTVSRPKPAVSFGGVFRIVDFTLSNCLNSGLTSVSLLTQYKHEELQSYIHQSWSGLWSGFDRESLKCVPPRGAGRYRGTADAVFQNVDLSRHGPEAVLILSADQIYRMDYRKLLSHHFSTNADLTIGVVEHSLAAAGQFGVVEVDSANKVVGFQEKPLNPSPLPSKPSRALISMGIYVFRRKFLVKALRENCKSGEGFDFGRHIIPSLLGTAQVRAYEFRDALTGTPGYWRDIGSIDTYYETNMDLVRPGTRFDPFANSKWPAYPLSHFRSSSAIRARLRTHCRVRRSILSPGVHIEDGSVVESSVLMSRVCIEKNAQIRNAIIEEGVRIPAGSQIGFDPDDDRRRHFVTDAGVVVVSQTSEPAWPTVTGAFRHVESRSGLLHSV